MEVTGTVVFDLGEISGVSKAGNNWKKHEYVLETQESYPKKVHFSFFGERADQFLLQTGQVIRLSFDIDSHEYNGRWFTSINAWKAEPADAPVAGGPAGVAPGVYAPAQPQAAATPQMPANMPPANSTDDLPF